MPFHGQTTSEVCMYVCIYIWLLTLNGSNGSGGGGASRASGTISGTGGSGIVILRFLTSGNTYTTSLLSNVWTEEGT